MGAQTGESRIRFRLTKRVGRKSRRFQVSFASKPWGLGPRCGRTVFVQCSDCVRWSFDAASLERSSLGAKFAFWWSDYVHYRHVAAITPGVCPRLLFPLHSFYRNSSRFSLRWLIQRAPALLHSSRVDRAFSDFQLHAFHGSSFIPAKQSKASDHSSRTLSATVVPPGVHAQQGAGANADTCHVSCQRRSRASGGRG